MSFMNRYSRQAAAWLGTLATVLALGACSNSSDESVSSVTPKAVQSFWGTVSCDSSAGNQVPMVMQTRLILDRGVTAGMASQLSSASAIQVGGLAGSLVPDARSQVLATIAHSSKHSATYVDFKVSVPNVGAFSETGRFMIGTDADGQATLQGESSAVLEGGQTANCTWNLAAAAPPEGPISYELLEKIFTPAANTPATAKGSATKKGTGIGGCGTWFTIGSEGALAGATISVLHSSGGFAAVFTAARIATTLAGNAEGNACMSAELAALTSELAIQSAQIQQIDLYLNLQQNTLYSAWYQTAVQDAKTAAYLWNVNLNGIAPQGAAKGMFGNWMGPGGLRLWDAVLKPRPGAPTTPQELALDDTAYAQARIQAIAGAANFQVYLKQFSGTDVITPSGSECTQATGCAAHVVPAANSALLILYSDLFKALKDKINVYANPVQLANQSSLTTNENVVPLFDAYHVFLVKFWTQALYVMDQAKAMEWHINSLNYFRAASSAAGASSPPIPSLGGVPGTYYSFGGRSAQQELDAYNAAQRNLEKVYAARMNQLYLNTLNFTVSDVPIGLQAYPAAPISVAYMGKTGTAKAIDYAGQVGRSIPDSVNLDLGKTPMSLIPPAARPQGAPWLSATVLYQFAGMNDVAACMKSLSAYLASNTTGNTISGWLQTPGACPSIFTRPDGLPVSYNCDTASPPNCSGSVYDGNTLTPYTSFQAATGATGGPLVLSAALVNNLKFCDPDSPGLVWESHRPGPRLNCGKWFTPAYLGRSFPRANPPAANENKNYYNSTTYGADFLFVQKPGGDGDLTFKGSKYPAIMSIMGSWPSGTPNTCDLIPTVPAIAGAPDTGTPIKENARTLLGNYHTANTTQGCSIGWLGFGFGDPLPPFNLTTYTSQDAIRFAPRLPRAINAGNDLGGFPLPMTIYAGSNAGSAWGYYSVRVRQGDLATEGYQCSPLSDSAFTCTIVDGSTYTVSMQGFGEGSTVLNFLLTQAP